MSGREAQDEYSLQSQQRMAAAQEAGLFADEIVPMETKMKVVDRETKEESIVDYTVERGRMQPPTNHFGRAGRSQTDHG